MARRSGHQCLEQPVEDGAQVEATIETVLELGKVAMTVLGKGKRMVSATDGGLQVAQQGIDCPELGPRSNAASSRPTAQCHEVTPADRRTPIRNAQSLYGSDTFPDQTATSRQR